MNKIVIKRNKKLVLKKVISQEFDNISYQDINRDINNYIKKVEALKVQTFGPLIIHNKGSIINEKNILVSSYDFYIQAHDYKQYKNQFTVLDEVVVEHCLYIRFEGKPEYLQLAFNKLEIYEYEEEIITRGDIYMISLEDTPEKIVMDIFKPVKMI